METKFDQLSLQDLVNVAKTCKFLWQAAGNFYQTNFPARVYSSHGNIYSGDSGVLINCFSQFIRSIFITGDNLDIFDSFRCPLLNEIQFLDTDLSFTESFSDILKNLEIIKFIRSDFDGDLHKTFLRHCKKLNRLYVGDNHNVEVKPSVGTSNAWLTKKYPKLEHFELSSKRRIDKVVQFLELNPNIRKFSASIEFLVKNMESILRTNIKFDTLAILHELTNITQTKFQTFVGQLLKIQSRGFFRKLHLYFTDDNHEYIIYPPNLLSFVRIMHFTDSIRKFELSPLINLEKLYILNTNKINDLDIALTKLSKLKNIQFYNEEIDNIIPFINHATKLNVIIVDNIKNGTHFNVNNNIVNLTALNDERGKLTAATRLRIYVQEEVYLATKKAYRNTKIDLIQIKRIESFKSSYDFIA